MNARRQKVKPPPQWNLSDLYVKARDPKMKREMREVLKGTAKFVTRYHGRVAKLRGEKRLLKAIETYEDLLQRAWKPLMFASLRHAENSVDPTRGAALQEIKKFHQTVRRDLIFFPLEVQSLSEKRLARLARTRTLGNYGHYLKILGQWRVHRLSEVEEKIVSDKGVTGRQALVRLYQEQMARRKFKLGRGAHATELESSDLLALFSHPSRVKRRSAAEAYSEGLRQEAPLSAYILNMLAEDQAIEEGYRHFDKPDSARHLTNQVGREVVDTMVGSVVQYYRLVRDYYEIKRKILGVRCLYEYDRYAPARRTGSPRQPFSFIEARAIVLKAFSDFSPEFGRQAEEFFRKQWIDATIRPGKRSGAFCSYGAPNTHPYVLMNFSGTLQDVFTLAHELGHGVHACFMREQSYLNFDVPLTVAETASVFSEMLVFDYLKSRTKSRDELLALYCGKVESILATVFRQVAIYRFEQDFHRLRRSEGELSVDRINSLWRAHQQKVYGPSMRLSPGFEYWWSGVAHLYHTPFYVYAYAFGELLTLSLFARYSQAKVDRLGAKFSERYLDLLRAGGRTSPADLLKPFGISLDDKTFWKSGLDMIAAMIKEIGN